MPFAATKFRALNWLFEFNRSLTPIVCYRNMGRVTDLMQSGKLFADLKLEDINRASDRVMICGSPGMLSDITALLKSRGFSQGNTTPPRGLCGRTGIR